MRELWEEGLKKGVQYVQDNRKSKKNRKAKIQKAQLGPDTFGSYKGITSFQTLPAFHFWDLKREKRLRAARLPSPKILKGQPPPHFQKPKNQAKTKHLNAFLHVMAGSFLQKGMSCRSKSPSIFDKLPSFYHHTQTVFRFFILFFRCFPAFGDSKRTAAFLFPAHSGASNWKGQRLHGHWNVQRPHALGLPGRFYAFGWFLSFVFIPGPPKVCFMKVFRYLKPTKRHSFGGPGIYHVVLANWSCCSSSFASSATSATSSSTCSCSGSCSSFRSCFLLLFLFLCFIVPGFCFCCA